LVDGKDPQPVVLDGRLRTSLDSRLMQGPLRPWIATLQGADPGKVAQLEELGARIYPLPAAEPDRVSLPALLEMLAGQGLDSLMVEGGAEVIGAFLAQKLVNLVVLTIAPVFIGGLRVIPPGGGVFPAIGGAFPRLHEMGCEILGEDLVVWGRLAA
jgi:riboflavin biosynthesis pyrimidine reductase